MSEKNYEESRKTYTFNYRVICENKVENGKVTEIDVKVSKIRWI